jgi:hypothetical protein
MKLKLNQNGTAVVKDGKPVYVHANGREEAFDAPAAWALALGKHFETSPVMAGLTIPHEIAASAFSDAFRIEGGKLVAVDKHGITMYSPTRYGEHADFNEAFAQLVNAYPNKAMIQREGGAPAAPGAGGGAPTGQSRSGGAVTRQQFDAMNPQQRAQHVRSGGKVTDGPGAPAPAAPNAGAKVISRAQLEQMPPPDRAAYFKSGGKIEG